ncbi:hypothetical protein NEOLEDRAFT_444202 [Neolentinus lepideus HHB14362 ss-1]|uniref:Uncharacterized protein n=1 Tax=Neolentinus lepideus HHB14362 ss-1 TaxID=1314782 RepID=A0A165RRH1_9AGAM|nr:hypothetical protein NEOLEDRAFT_444202 [Neolentinus lepideus HHB14362 ss-1]
MRIFGPKHKSTDPSAWSLWLSSLSAQDKSTQNDMRNKANEFKKQQLALLDTEGEGGADASGSSAGAGRTLSRVSSFASMISMPPDGDDTQGGGGVPAPPAPPARPQTPPRQISLSSMGSPSRWSPVTKLAMEIAKDRTSLLDYLSKKRSVEEKPAEEDEDNSRVPKKMRALRTTDEEIPSEPGAPSGLDAFHEEIKILFWNKQYLPISLFIFDELNRFMVGADLMPKRKLDNKMRILDLSAIDLTDEHSLTTGQWREAVDNYIRFCKLVGAEDFVQRWQEHFNWFIRLPAFEKQWPSIRETDIALRRQYRTRPFQFNPAAYQMKHLEISELIRKGALQTTPSRPSGRQGQPSRGGPSHAGDAQPMGRARGGGAGPAQGRAPFRMGGGGDPSASICLICSRRGHLVPGCTSGQFPGGGQVFAEARNGSLFARGRDEEICRRWNVAGTQTCRQTDHPARRHICSFCGSGDHHAFSWSCKPKPN